MASCVMMPSSGTSISGGPSCTGVGRGVWTSSPAHRSSRLMQVRCSSNKDSGLTNNPVAAATATLSTLQKSIDRFTKKELSRADIERHQTEATSEKQSVFGTQPPQNVPWPRPELERRPETGDRSLGSLFAVDGAVPETVNGRMAMVGFVWALVVERMTGLSVAEQLFHPATSGLLWFGAVVQIFSLATIIPFLNGESTDARSWGPFNAKAERWNGRLAMIGFASLLIDEMVRQGPLLY